MHVSQPQYSDADGRALNRPSVIFLCLNDQLLSRLQLLAMASMEPSSQFSDNTHAPPPPSTADVPPTAAPAPSWSASESPEEQRRRFEIELEFVQCLANPHYLHHLAQTGFLDKKESINYLEYLQYWKSQEYAKLIAYPQCLFFLDMLQEPGFRAAMRARENADFLAHRQALHWHTFRNRNLIVAQLPVAPPPSAGPGSVGAAAAGGSTAPAGAGAG
ncbi:hypothetical protein AMAG_02329 [Allomyces macrogynus ATCC 38327]|uniref:Mediator of RNA polymerase II transcription subunit 31 n=1 Tax=Allomyces macrogynus (strain ATCC 38327) TaxID=578462 RepID=A0A0L0S1W1_ALLM3|nr:hypothetical protein AMAG_02329 [Allomyces macrogynus ATCC 38327]|eukprot:KNE56528.1 hypothetical protein AMAG_02329 [Allomyces macrogynus ATCC 38327]